ncbi:MULTISPECIES: hypothetical protein [unclassified Acinetobacter]|uniref:hypothetical protein n=1 Tax=unclassified Acinetobacter TaxID=196816 RepID=UPI0015D197E8
MNLKAILWVGSIGFALHGCTTMQSLNPNSFNHYASPQEVINQKGLNSSNGKAKEYVYDWGPQNKNMEAESLIPKQNMSSYCQAKNGKFIQLNKSNLNQVKNAWSRKLLATYSSIKQSTGVFQCSQADGQRWMVAIEPVSERKSNDRSETRLVSLYTAIIGPEERRKNYNKQEETVAKKATPSKAKATTTKSNAKEEAKKEVETKKETKAKEPEKKPVVKPVAETSQQIQMRLYVNARRDLNAGKNQVTACNNAQRAYSYGKLNGANANRAYAESGMLVAKCLTSVPAYSKSYPNANARAKGILQNLATNYNHAGAKNMLNRMK